MGNSLSRQLENYGWSNASIYLSVVDNNKSYGEAHAYIRRCIVSGYFAGGALSGTRTISGSSYSSWGTGTAGARGY